MSSDVALVECSMGLGEKADKVADFLRRFGDDLPEESIRHAVEPENLSRIHTVCNEHGDIVAMGLWEQADWYLCTIKNVATDPDYRRKGLGSRVVSSAIVDAIDNGCLVLSADISQDNIASHKLFEKRGFKKVNEFCWREGEQPADILHYVLIPPEGGKCLTSN